MVVLVAVMAEVAAVVMVKGRGSANGGQRDRGSCRCPGAGRHLDYSDGRGSAWGVVTAVIPVVAAAILVVVAVVAVAQL